VTSKIRRRKKKKEEERRNHELTTRPLRRKSNTLTTRLPWHRSRFTVTERTRFASTAYHSVTLTFDLHTLISRGWWIFPVSSVKTVQVVHAIGQWALDMLSICAQSWQMTVWIDKCCILNIDRAQSPIMDVCIDSENNSSVVPWPGRYCFTWFETGCAYRTDSSKKRINEQTQYYAVLYRVLLCCCFEHLCPTIGWIWLGYLVSIKCAWYWTNWTSPEKVYKNKTVARTSAVLLRY